MSVKNPPNELVFDLCHGSDAFLLVAVKNNKKGRHGAQSSGGGFPKTVIWEVS